MKRNRSLNIVYDSLDNQLVLDNLLANMPGHVYWKNKKGVYFGCNDRQAQSLGFLCGRDVIGKTDFELPWDSELAKRFWNNDSEVLETGQAITVEESAIVNGQPAIVLSLKVPLKERSGITVGILGISVDITQQKRAEAKLMQAKEAVEAANHVKLEFLENMRHDLRTPLVGIIGCANAIKDKLENIPNSTEINSYAADLVTSSQALLNLLNDVLDSIKVATGTIPILKKRFHLNDILLEIIQLNQARAKEKALDLLFEYDHAIPRYLIGDPVRLKRLVLELVTNALNFTQQGYVKIKTELVKRINQSIILKIKIEDTGMGIPVDKQQAVFTCFQRLSLACEGNYRGAGLGLSLIKQFIEDIEGEIYLESQPNVGSIFTCVIPLKISLLDDERDVSATIPSLPKSNERMNSETGKNISILLVEDDVIASKVMTALLTKLGCLVKLASNGKQALLEAKSGKIDLIFLDIGLPDINGIDVAKQIRRCQNSLTPIIAVTAHLDADQKDKCLQVGMNSFLQKPISQEIVVAILHQFIK